MAKLYLRFGVVAFSSVFFLLLLKAQYVSRTADTSIDTYHPRPLDVRMPNLVGQGTHNDVHGQVVQDFIRDRFGEKGDVNAGIIQNQDRDADLTLISDRNSTKHIWGWHETVETLKMCEDQHFEKEGPLPDVSVIICFHDKENISNVLLTVHSVVQRTPVHMLHEVILVDDRSSKDDLAGILDLYIQNVFGDTVWIYRSPEKLGLIKARAKGISLARGEVVVSMDSHVEVQKGWIEPMLYEIRKNPKTLAASYLDWVEKKGEVYEYRHGGTTWKSYFDWNFVFGWQALSKKQIDDRTSHIEPIPSPVIIGTIFAINREYFAEVGGFDEQMELWGGENLDLPIRIWLCGGRVINIPCSRVAHLETPGSRDYRNQWQNIILKNYKRFAEVWLGDYKKYFYMYNPNAKHIPTGDLTSRFALRDKCPRDFDWLLKNVFPELGIPDRDSYAWGQLRSLGYNKRLCLDTFNTFVPMLGECSDSQMLPTQIFFWSKKQELRIPMHLFQVRSMKSQEGQNIMGLYEDEYTSNYFPSKRTSTFIHWKGGPFMASGDQSQCLQAIPPNRIELRKCDAKNKNQKWEFQFYQPEYQTLLTGTSELSNTIKKEQLKFYGKPVPPDDVHNDPIVNESYRKKDRTLLPKIVKPGIQVGKNISSVMANHLRTNRNDVRKTI